MSDAIEPSDLGHAAPAPGVDPVCGMTVDPKTALSSEWNEGNQISSQ